MNNVPETLDAAVSFLYGTMTPEQVTEMAEIGSGGYHFGTGMAIRNNWGLWTGGPLKEFFKQKYGLGHADDMSGMILSALEAKCKGEVYDAEADAQHYREYWRKQNVDPLTLEELANG